jgi:hypothetical protein
MIPPNKKKNPEHLNKIGQEDLRNTSQRKHALKVLAKAKSQEDKNKPIKVIVKGEVRYIKP